MNLSKPQKLARKGDFETALQLLTSAAVAVDHRAELLRARTLISAGNTDEGTQALQELSVRLSSYAPGHLFYGIALWDAGEIATAAEQFERVIELQRGNDLAQSYKALCCQAVGDSPSAIQIWKTHGFSDNTDFRIRVIELIEKAWLFDQSYLGAQPLTEVPPPQHPSERKALSEFYKRNFLSVLQHVPPPPTEKELSAFLGATAHEMLRNYAGATAYLDPLLPRREEWPDALIALHGRLLCRAGRFTEAANELAKVLIIGPEDFGVNYYLGVISLAFGKGAEARNFFRRALTSYMVDTLEFQWWQIEQALLNQPVTSIP